MFVEEKKQGEFTTLEPWRELLLKVADHYENGGGWIQHDCKDDHGMCVSFALCNLNGGANDTYNAAYVKLSEYVGSGYLPTWNDRPDTTKARVIAALRATAWGWGG
jgi:hypothetical protein